MMPWAVRFRSNNKLDGYGEQFVRRVVGDVVPALFHTRKEARTFKDSEYGYITKRHDLRVEPHGWLPAQVVRVAVKIVEAK